MTKLKRFLKIYQIILNCILFKFIKMEITIGLRMFNKGRQHLTRLPQSIEALSIESVNKSCFSLISLIFLSIATSTSTFLGVVEHRILGKC